MKFDPTIIASVALLISAKAPGIEFNDYSNGYDENVNDFTEGMPDFNNGYSCDVRFESIAKKLEPDLESPCGLLDKNDDVVVEDYEVDEDGQIFEEDDECDGEGVINDQIEEISNERLDDVKNILELMIMKLELTRTFVIMKCKR
ncbi:15225_t:CDS:2 [Entrophospora sp. SA101]|nr:7461_t:CDS:2 [Entrophospora sp. SA101]CAJ0768019.1 15224_t:CDS:2 [Entrophospora sp. SA101]CAJ0768020.1 15225_t:CDS:2 [Entrophospora sp. SA101]